MTLFYQVLVFSLFAAIIEGKSLYTETAEEKNALSPANKLKILDRLNTLNEIHTELRGDPFPQKKITDDFLDKDVGRSPMRNPYLYQGDIILTDKQWDALIEDARAQLRARKNPSFTKRVKPAILSDPIFRWTFPIYFYINTNLNVTEVLAGVRRYEQETCARFVRTSSVPSGPGLEFVPGSGCMSYIGQSNNVQPIYFAPECTHYVGIVWHEIAHALGIIHEQSRSNRDNFVHILKKNIGSSDLQNFEKEQLPTSSYGVGYDYGSVMHYGGRDFAFSGTFSIKTIDRKYQKTIGQRYGPSFADIKTINLAYCSGICSNTLPCQNGGYPDPNNCNRCKCPIGLGGQLCGVVATSSGGNCGSGDLTATNTMKTLSASGKFSCYYLIKAPPGRKIYFRVTHADFPLYFTDTCPNAFAAINFSSDLSKTEVTVCGVNELTVFRSETNQLLVIYNGYNRDDYFTSFTMEYRIESSASAFMVLVSNGTNKVVQQPC